MGVTTQASVTSARGRALSVPETPKHVNTQAFAGRLGGNQLYTVTSREADDEQVKQSDAIRAASWKTILDPRGFSDPILYRNAGVECVGLALQVFVSGLMAAGVGRIADATSLGVVTPVLIASIFQIIQITLFIFAAGPVSGAHFNPLLTFATFTTKLTSLPRAVLYILAQCAGAVIGAFVLRAALGEGTEGLIRAPGCYVDSSLVSRSEAFALETVGSIFLLFLAFGLGLDPRNGSTLGPAMSTWLIGFTAGITLFAGGIARPGYLGFSNNPARCLGLMSASHHFEYHWIHWVGDGTACA